MHQQYIQTIETLYKIAWNKTIKYSDRREIAKELIKKANSIYRKLYKSLSFGERKEAREPINDLKKYFSL